MTSQYYVCNNTEPNRKRRQENMHFLHMYFRFRSSSGACTDIPSHSESVEKKLGWKRYLKCVFLVSRVQISCLMFTFPDDLLLHVFEHFEILNHSLTIVTNINY